MSEERSFMRPVEVSPVTIGPVRAYLSGRAIWVRCGAHGSQAPIVTEDRLPGFGPRYLAQPICPSCRQDARLVTIETPAKRGGQPTECNGACLAGKRSCSCRCAGRCHGAGVCRCGDRAAQGSLF